MTNIKDLKNRIINGFVKSCSLEGVENVTLQKVADASKTPYSTVHYHFGKPGELLEAGFKSISDSSANFVGSGLTLHLSNTKVSSLAAYIDSKFLWQKKHPLYASLWVFFLYMSTRSRLNRKSNTAVYFSGITKIKELIIQDVGKGFLLLSPDLENIAARIELVLIGFLLLGITTDVGQAQAKSGARETISDILRPSTLRDLWQPKN